MPRLVTTSPRISRWEMARNDFFEAFKNYDEAGVQRRVQCLKYLVMSTMLTNSDINPFDSQARTPARPPARRMLPRA